MDEINISFTNAWFVDIKKFIYDKLSTNPLIIDEIWENNVFLKDDWSDLFNKNKFIFFGIISETTNSFWIRNCSVQIDLYSESIEKTDNIKEIIINLFNRSNYKGIKSLLVNDLWNKIPARKWLVRNTLNFDFVFKDMKY